MTNVMIIVESYCYMHFYKHISFASLSHTVNGVKEILTSSINCWQILSKNCSKVQNQPANEKNEWSSQTQLPN